MVPKSFLMFIFLFIKRTENYSFVNFFGSVLFIKSETLVHSLSGVTFTSEPRDLHVSLQVPLHKEGVNNYSWTINMRFQVRLGYMFYISLCFSLFLLCLRFIFLCVFLNFFFLMF